MIDRTSRLGRVSRLIPTRILAKKRIWMCGMGTVGSCVAVQLARHGVGCRSPGLMHFVDGDFVQKRNLNGSIYRVPHLGMKKVDAMKQHNQEIDEKAKVTTEDKMLTKADVSRITKVAKKYDLMCLFADDGDLMLRIGESCYGRCPMILALLGRRCDVVEVAFSIPNKTATLPQTIGRRSLRRIEHPEALGVDTMFATSYVAAMCLSLLLYPKTSNVLPKLDMNAPLHLIGLRREWLFSEMPEDQPRTILAIENPIHNH